MSGVQLMAQVSPDQTMVYEEKYEVDELILPKQAGSYTLFSITPIYRRDDATLRRPNITLEADRKADRACTVVWIAADDEAFALTLEKAKAAYQAAQRQAAIAQAQPKILIPGH